MTSLLAHQGGWDEALLFAGPLILVFLIIGAFERRGHRSRDDTEQPTEGDHEHQPGE